ncbi:phosphoglycolate phosphatase [Rosenbergiella epipactidis]|uniref:phosphoglycolate phosphatase n=1 Tax=Rosenbergiella epipactidis TaxID=1544694 RepID=UPI001F4F979F|nr:phosphoglycolate phosphatase [Rosenbergiella epipactidis]
MDSFAASDLQFDDGQNNIESIPDEVQQYGFRPPVRGKDGSIIAGHKLTANHLNYILNDLYAQIAELKSRVNS